MKPRLPMRLNRPEYLFPPTNGARRLLRGVPRWARVSTRDVQLRWGLTLTVSPEDAIGSVIVACGIHNLNVSEAIARLVDPGDLTIDVGANMGYMTSISARMAGPTGRVLAYEPHPEVHALLEHNVARWNKDKALAPTVARASALSNRAGLGRLQAPSHFSENKGTAWLAEHGAAEGYEVRLDRLDAGVLERTIGLVKIDVEGHEDAVIEGAEGLLRRHAIRDVIFEDHGAYPTPAARRLAQHGYTLLTLDNELFGLVVEPPGAQPRRSAEVPSYLATVTPERALRRLAPKGWAVLGIGARWRSIWETPS